MCFAIIYAAVLPSFPCIFWGGLSFGGKWLIRFVLGGIDRGGDGGLLGEGGTTWNGKLPTSSLLRVRGLVRSPSLVPWAPYGGSSPSPLMGPLRLQLTRQAVFNGTRTPWVPRGQPAADHDDVPGLGSLTVNVTEALRL